jgi:hypothetical protein
MKNILIIFLFLFSFDCIAQDSTNQINFTFQDDYMVSVPSLYLKCRNDIYFTISDDTNLEKLSYEVHGGELIIKDKSSYFTIVPTASKITLEVFYDGKTIVKQHFNVKLIPKPIIKLEQPSDKALTIFPQKIDITISADETFQKELPNDSNYEAKEYKVYLLMGKQIIVEEIFTKNIDFTEEEIKKYTELIKAQPKEDWRLVVGVTKIERTNYKKETEEISTGSWGIGEYFTLPIELK